MVKSSHKDQFIRVLMFVVIFVVFTLMIYQRTHNSSVLIAPEQSHSEMSGKLQTNHSSVVKKLPDVILNAPTYRETKSNLQSSYSNSDLLQKVKELSGKVKESLDWVSEMKAGSTGGYPLIRWDLMSNAEIHILNKLGAFLKKALNDKDAEAKFSTLISKGYQCNAVQAAQQEVISKRISMDICSEIEWYKVVHLAWPDVRNIIDIGGNKGYLGSLFVSLWGGGGLRVAPVTIFNLSNKLKSWKDSRNPAGYCKDGYSFGIPLYCGGSDKRDEVTGACSTINEDLRVTSIDGSSYLRDTLSDMISNEIPKMGGAANKVPSIWRYLNYAMSDRTGTARFTKQSKDQNAGFEGGSIRGNADATTEEVNMTSVDLFMRASGMTSLDLLKIDTEGNDNKVLVGAQDAIKSTLGMFTFEGGKGVLLSQQMIDEYDALGFSCYSTSRAGLFKWSGGCMKEQYTGPFQNKDKGNIFCVSRQRAPMVTLAYDILSFPMLIETYLGSERVSDTAYKKLVTDIQQAESAESINPSDLIPIYVNIKPFCAPWPSCVNKM